MTTRATDSPVTPGTSWPIATTIRDALYDRIPMAAPELALLETRPFLRLDRIQQLGFVSRVWPGAKHTRYEHSLGVFHLTRLAVAHLRTTAEGTAIEDQDARTICAAALLHDIGHYPFSHAVEELGPPILSHEEVGRGVIEGSEIGPILRSDWDVDPARVAAIVAPAGRDLPPVDRLLRGILSGPLDMDKLDYLPRDARACNVPYGGVDTARLIDALTITETPDGTIRIGIAQKGVSPLHSLINARQEMFDNVYWHHTNRACMAMLLRAVQEALLARALAPGDLTDHDDASLLALLNRTEMPAETRRLTTALTERRIYKRAVEISARAFELYARLGNLFFDPAARREVERRLASGLADLTGEPVPPETLLNDVPKPERWRTDVWVRFGRPPVGFTELMPWREVVGLEDADFKRYEEHRRLIRIVAAEPYRDAVSRSWERLVMPLLGGAF
ncbi:MAG: dNTP triphosphohydrolase, broad substrate specificity [uncultured Thermomicrobiales bacterium]|uniref:DNTP triphosphohydrolase, broad substrate specificity n=1 Tax=uncultured Thermomicrobiales bacterium TaxID=1645740 RepID=A0A6J4VAR9_9BACT|nr:MAG: dNTP triphosphohydrolase, broad substrate specificity [uncultured Thermomicrobiales bacterium]